MFKLQALENKILSDVNNINIQFQEIIKYLENQAYSAAHVFLLKNVDVQLINHEQKIEFKQGNEITEPVMTIFLNGKNNIYLIWKQKFYLRKIAHLKVSNQEKILITDWPLDSFTNLFQDYRDLGDTGEIGLCEMIKDKLNCFPTRFNSKPFQVSAIMNGLPLPITRALNGEKGIIETFDYRKRRVVAAIVGFKDLGFGMTVKMEPGETYQDLKSILIYTLPLTLLIIFLGVIILYLQVLPFSRSIVLSRKEADLRKEQLIGKEKYLKTLIDNVAEGIIVANYDGIIESFNPKACQIFGYTQEEIIGQDLKVLMHPDMHARHEAGMKRYKESLTPKLLGMGAVELPALHKKGNQFLIELSINKIDFDKQISFVGIVKDISERKIHESNLLEAKKTIENSFLKLHGLIESIYDGIAAFDLEFKYIAFNKSYREDFLKIFGKDIKIGMSIKEAMQNHPKESKAVIYFFEKALNDKSFTRIEMVGNPKASLYAYEITYNSILDVEGKKIGVTQVARNISEKLKIENELKKSEERFQLLSLASNDLILDWNYQTDMIWFNDKINVDYGYSIDPNHVDGQWWKSLIHPEDKTDTLLSLQAAISRKLTLWKKEFRLKKANGVFAYVLNRSHLIWDKIRLLPVL